MEDQEILLRIRREFSKNEKYRYLLKYLDDVELDRARERKLNTDLIKENFDLVREKNELSQKLSELQKQYKKLETKQSRGEFISPERHAQVCKERSEFEKKYHNQVRENIELQHQIEKLKTLIEGIKKAADETQPL